ncbi:MAG: hypothetical protein WKG07_42110 [Hymenobacter sp.]
MARTRPTCWPATHRLCPYPRRRARRCCSGCRPLPPHEQAAAAAKARRQPRARPGRPQPPGNPTPEAAPSTKEVYRQLARQHHPDRIAQADAAAQQTQTALMQRITAAYAAGDLAALLSLLAANDGPTPAQPRSRGPAPALYRGPGPAASPPQPGAGRRPPARRQCALERHRKAAAHPPAPAQARPAGRN